MYQPLCSSIDSTP